MIGIVKRLEFSELVEDSVNVRMVGGIVDEMDMGTDKNDRD